MNEHELSLDELVALHAELRDSLRAARCLAAAGDISHQIQVIGRAVASRVASEIEGSKQRWI